MQALLAAGAMVSIDAPEADVAAAIATGGLTATVAIAAAKSELPQPGLSQSFAVPKWSRPYRGQPDPRSRKQKTPQRRGGDSRSRPDLNRGMVVLQNDRRPRND